MMEETYRDRLGDILIECSLITSEQLDQAVQCQVLFGGRLGTNLLECNFITEEKLLDVLSDKYGVPKVDMSMLEDIPAKLIDIIPAEIADRYQVIPLKLVDQVLTVVFMDPWKESTLKVLGSKTGYNIAPAVGLEVHLRWAMERYYGVKRDARFINLERILKVRKEPGDIFREGRARPMLAAAARARLIEEEQPARDKAEFKAGPEEERTPEEERSAEQERPPEEERTPEKEKTPEEKKPEEGKPGEKITIPSHSPGDTLFDAGMVLPPLSTEPILPEQPDITSLEGAPRTLEDFWDRVGRTQVPSYLVPRMLREINQAKSRDQIAEIILDFAGRILVRCALFFIKDGIVFGWDGRGLKITSEQVQGIMIPLDRQSVFHTMIDTGSFFLGPIPDIPINRRFLAAMGGIKPASAVLIPLYLENRVVAIFYGDMGPGREAPKNLSDLQNILNESSKALCKLVQQQKAENPKGRKGEQG